MDSLLRDLRHGLGDLAKHRAFSGVALLTLLLGIGVNVAIFSIVSSILLKPLPFREPDRLMVLWTEFARMDLFKNGLSDPEIGDFRDQATTFEGIAGFAAAPTILTGVRQPTQLPGASVTANFFSLLGARAALGRPLTPADGEPGAPKVVVVSHAFWQQEFGSDPAALGKSLTINGIDHDVVGVMPASFAYPAKAELWRPLVLDPANPRSREMHFITTIARLREGVSPAAAESEARTIAARLAAEYPDAYPADAGWGVQLVPLAEEEVGGVRTTLLVLLGAGGLVLLIACANLMHLLLARAQQRRHELAVRSALGATERRLVRQMVAESVALSLVGGALGLAAGWAGLRALLAVAPPDIPRLDEVRVDLPVFAFAVAVSLAVGVACGVLPALRTARGNLHGFLKEGSTRVAGGARGRRVRIGLAVSQVALALLVLTGAGLLVRNYDHLRRVDPGFEPRGVLTAQIVASPWDYPEDAQRAEVFRRILERAGTLPGVQEAGLVSMLPFSGMDFSGGFTVENSAAASGEERSEASRRSVNGAYFRAMGIELVEGRVFTPADDAAAPGVVIVDRAFAERYWPGESAVGKRVRRGGPTSDLPWLSVVGVVDDVKHESLDADSRVHMYFPYQQYAPEIGFLTLKTTGDPAALAGPLRAEIAAVGRHIPTSTVQTMEAWLGESLSRPGFSMLLLSVFAGVALLLAMIGVYGVMMHSVADRTHEIAVRMSLGAQPVQVLRQVVGRGLLYAAMGVAAGLLAALLVTPVLASQMYGVSTYDPLTFVAMATVLVATTGTVTWIAARGVTRVDPMRLLRS